VLLSLISFNHNELTKFVDNTSHPTSEIDCQDAEEAMPDLPTDPISFDDEHWELGLEDGGNVDGSWNDGDDNDHSVSNSSSVTLSSRASKRTYEEYESDGEGYEDDNGRQWELSGSPGMAFKFIYSTDGLTSSKGAKRSRIE